MNFSWLIIIQNILIVVWIFLLILFILTRFRLKFFKKITDKLNLELKKSTEDLKIANEELKVLNAIGEIGISTLDVNDVLDRLIKIIVDMTKFETGRIFLYDLDKQLEIRASHNVKDNLSKDELESIYDFLNTVINHGKITVSYEYSKPMLGVPLKVGDTIFGVAQIEGEVKYKFSSREVKLMELIADRASLSIDRTKTYKQVERLAEELSMISYIGNVISSTLDIDELFSLVTRTAVEIMNAEVSTLRLIDNSKQELILKSTYGLSESYIFKGNVKIGKSIVGRVVKDKIPIVVSNLQQDARYEYPELAKKGGLESLISIPIILKDVVLGALCVYTKEERNFDDIDIKVLSTFTNHAAVAIENARLFTSIKDTYLATVKAFAEALSVRDSYTRGHSEQVAKYARAIAEKLNLSEKDIEIVEYGAILHDIGKIGIEDKILNKPSSLNKEEYEVIKKHPIIASKILEPLNWFNELLPIITHHHERFDGGGYPAGLSHENIPFLARILLVVDSFEAMTSDRPYRKAFSDEEALNELKRNSGTQFDPEIVDAFLKVFEKNK